MYLTVFAAVVAFGFGLAFRRWPWIDPKSRQWARQFLLFGVLFVLLTFVAWIWDA